MGFSDRIVAAILARNEAGEDRFLRTVLQNCRQWADRIVLVDDGSDDETGALARSFDAIVHRRDGIGMWGQEASARAMLWDVAAREAGDGWIVIVDADQVLDGWEHLRGMAASWVATAWCWPLLDMWTPQEYRVDGYWQAHLTPRPWMFRPSVCQAPIWASRGIHCGHAPENFPYQPAIAPDGVRWRHFAYSTPVLRVRKHAQYLGQRHQLTPHELAHAESILDPLP